MKNSIYTVLLVALAAVLFVSCESADKGKGKLDPNAKVYINAAVTPAGVASKAEHMTAKEIVEQCTRVSTVQWLMDIGDWNRDLVKNRFIVSSTWAIGQDGTLTTDMIEATDYVFSTLNTENRPKDTIAYIPNATMRAAEKAVKAAYAAEDYAACYKLFEEGFVFTPITGAEWRALKAVNAN